MNLIKSLKGAIKRMIKKVAPVRMVNRKRRGVSVLEKRKYVIEEISRSTVQLPPGYSTLSMTKYFLDEDDEDGNDMQEGAEIHW